MNIYDVAEISIIDQDGVVYGPVGTASALEIDVLTESQVQLIEVVSEGPQGPPGDTGPQGEQGIQGGPGPKGDPGLQGEQGIPGVPGEKGEKGDQGIQGPAGADGDWSSPQTIETKTAAYTLVAGDAGKTIVMNLESNADLIVPADVLTAGQSVEVLDIGAGRTTYVAGSGMTLSGTPSLVSRDQYSGQAIRFLSATSAVVVGDLA